MDPQRLQELQQRAQRLLAAPVDFIPSPEFATAASAAEILAAPPEPLRTPRTATIPDGIPTYLSSLYSTPLLTPGQERHQFRRFNFLKYRAHAGLARLNPKRPNATLLDQIEADLAAAEAVRNQIVQANLRLVVANARHFCDQDHTFEDLVSDGNLSLVQAVEKFDYSRGFRFSTYATHAIRRTYFRRMGRKQKEKTRVVFAPPELLQEAPEVLQSEHIEHDQARLYELLLARMAEKLSERELLILKCRFAIDSDASSPTLQVLAADLGICKERVRQLQNRAISKLRTFADEIESELGVEFRQRRGLPTEPVNDLAD